MPAGSRVPSHVQSHCALAPPAAPVTPGGQHHPRRLHPRRRRRRAAPRPPGHAHWRVTGPVRAGHRGPPGAAATHARWTGRGPQGPPPPAAPRPPAPPPRMRSGPTGKGEGGRARNSSLPFSCRLAGCAPGSAAPPAPQASRGAAPRRHPTPPGSAGGGGGAAKGKIGSARHPPASRERWRAQPAPLLTLSPASRRGRRHCYRSAAAFPSLSLFVFTNKTIWRRLVLTRK